VVDNLPASGGTVTKIQLLLTPDVEDNGLPANPQVLSTWAPLLPDTAAFAVVPKAYSPSAITMKATTGEVAFGYTGTVEYLFTETTGNPGATSSGWQTSPSYTDTGLQAGTQYSYTVSMRAGSLTSTTSAAASATTLTASATNNVTVNSTQQFSLATTKGFQNVTGLGTFNAGGADKLVVVISTEDGSNRGTGYVYGVKYNGKTMIQAIQEHGGPANGSAAIFYLDNPGSIGTGTIQVSAESPNGGIGTAYALSNTMTGVGVTNSRFGSTANSVSLTTAGERSMVIAVLQNSGNPNNAGTPTANSPLTQTASGSWGTFWGSHASGYQLVATPTAITPTFTTLTGSGYNINIAAAEFPAKAGTVPVVLPNVWNQSDGGAQNWTTAANWSDSVVPNPTSTTTMDFSTVDILADTTLNLGANRTARIWKFGDTAGTENWIVSAGNTLTLAGTTPTIQVDNNTTQIDAVVAGTAGLTKTGAGTLNLTGNNTYTGNTTLTGGTLQFAKTAAMPATGTVAVGNEATLAVNLGGTGEWTTATSGNGSVGGLLAGVGGQGNPVTYTGNTTLGLDTTNASGNQTYASAITNVGTSLGFAKLGNGTLTLTAANTYSGPTTIGGGTLRFSGAGRLTSGNTTGTYASPVFIAGDAILEYSGSSGQTFSGAITGGGNLKSTTNVDFIMSNKANDFGSFSIGNGRVFINTNAGALPSAAAVDITGGLLVFGSATEVSDNPFTVASNGGIVTRRTSGGTILTNVKLPGTGTVIFNNDDVNTGTLNITNDLIVDEYDPVTGDLISTGAQILTGTLTIQVGGSRMSTTTGSLGGVIFGGKIIGNGSLNVTSGGNAGNTNGLYRSGVLTLTAPNDYAGGTTITTGTLALGDNNVLPATPLTIADGKLDAATFSDTLGTLAITGNATINLGAGAALSFANSSAVSWPGTLTLTGDFTSGSSIRFGNSGTALTSAQLSKISKSAPNALDRFSLNSAGYLVGATVGSPTYTITNTSPAGNGTCTPTGVTSVGSGGSQTYTLKPNAGYALGTLTVNGVSVPPVLSYAFDNVSANQTISATFVVQPTATLYWDSDGTTPGFGNTPGTWGSTSFWTTDSSGSSPLIAITTDTASLVNFGSATLNYDNPAVAIAQEGVEAREITFGAGQSTALTLSGGNITFFSTAVITVNNNSHTIEAALTGADTSLTKAGTGSLTLSGNNTYTGTTVIAAGTLRLGASDVIPDGPGNGNVTVTSTLDLQTFSETINGLDGNGTVDTAGGGSSTLTVGGANTTSTFNGTLTDTNGTLALAKIGSGNLTLTGNNTYTGQTTITAGNLIIGAGGTTGSIDSTTGINNAGALIYNRSNNATVAYSISGNGTLTKQGAGVLTLSGDNSYTGATTVSSGTLRLASSAALGNSTLVAIGGNRLEIVTDTALSASPALSSQVGTFVSDRATPGAGLTQVFGNASIGNGLTTFAAGGNVTSGAAVIQLGNVTNNNGSTATPGLNPTTANLVITGNVTLGASNAGTANLTLGGNSSENSIGGAIVNGTRVTGNVIKSNTSTWTLSGTNTYTGNTSVTGGLLITTKAAALPGFNTAAKVVFNGGTIGAQVGGSGWTEGEMLGLIGNATKTSGALGIDTTNGNLTQGATAYSLGNLGLTKLGANTLTLTQTNTYNGTTTISEGTLALGANNVLPATAVTVGNATLNAGTFTDTVGTLNVAGNATINLGSGAALAFADSSAMDWSNGTLTLTGNFTSGSSLRFGTSNSSLTSTQLGKISAPGGGAVALNPSGFLINALGGYAAWAATNASGTTPAQDQDNDGVSNAIEYVLGGTALTNDFAKLPLVSMSGGNILFTFLRDQASINASTSAAIQVSTTLLTWPTSFTVGADTATSSPGVTVIKGSPAGFDTVTLSVLQSAYPNFFGRLSVTITQ
jgi:autotransporter-associated beta strand protein